MNYVDKIVDALSAYATPERKEANEWFFKTGPGEYGENDKFLGVNVPDCRKVAKQFRDADMTSIESALHDELHEVRLTSLFILVEQFRRGDEERREEIYHFYLDNMKYVNNWDLVDSSAHKIVGAYLEDRKREILYELAESEVLWERRIAIIATFWLIGQDDFFDSLAIAEKLLDEKEDLIHKAVGWMLREIGKRDQDVEEMFLQKHYRTMPRTMLRYAIERFEEPRRLAYLKGNV